MISSFTFSAPGGLVSAKQDANRPKRFQRIRRRFRGGAHDDLTPVFPRRDPSQPLGVLASPFAALASGSPEDEKTAGPRTVKTGGARAIPIDGGKYRVWVKKVGTGPIHVLTLHGGPGVTHEYFECFEDFLPQAGITFWYYDQLGSGFSDQPDDTSLWTVDRFRDEVEQVRAALALENFYLFGQSWGGMLGIEYALSTRSTSRASSSRT